jgi:hypothetical protein
VCTLLEKHRSQPKTTESITAISVAASRAESNARVTRHKFTFTGLPAAKLVPLQKVPSSACNVSGYDQQNRAFHGTYYSFAVHTMIILFKKKKGFSTASRNIFKW